MTAAGPNRLVIFGASNILSDLFDCALANGIIPVKVVIHLPEESDERSIPVASRTRQLAPMCTPPVVVPLSDFQPARDELYLLGPTTPTRSVLAALLRERFALAFHTLIHPTAYVSPLATLGEGTFRGGEGTRPAVGEAGRDETAVEYRVETVVPEAKLAAVVDALRRAHPYEEPAFDVYERADVERGRERT